MPSPNPTPTTNEPIRRSVEGVLRYMHSYEYHPVWKTSQVLARLTGSTVAGRNTSGMSEWDHHLQACYLVRILRREVGQQEWTILRAVYLPLTEYGEPEKEIACARVADRLLEYLDDPDLDRDWMWDLVRGWAGLPMWKSHSQWARELCHSRSNLHRHRFGSTEIE
ncbi:MAG TPA: hypothetical protein VKA48_00110, partial [Gammaproteobacteria bacterium]|nr:hypothetical protein [Gammaproteobacteria bacterium]